MPARFRSLPMARSRARIAVADLSRVSIRALLLATPMEEEVAAAKPRPPRTSSATPSFCRRALCPQEAAGQGLPLGVVEEGVRGGDELAAVGGGEAELGLVEALEPVALGAQPGAGLLADGQALPALAVRLDGEQPAAAVVLALRQRGLAQQVHVHL